MRQRPPEPKRPTPRIRNTMGRMPKHTPRDLIYVADQALANDVTELSTQPGGSYLHERIRVTDAHARALEMIDLWDLDPAHEISRFLRGSTEIVPDSPFELICEIEEQAETIEDLEGEIIALRSPLLSRLRAVPSVDDLKGDPEDEADEVRDAAREALEEITEGIQDAIDYLGRKGSHKKKAQDMLLAVIREIEEVSL